MRIKILLAFLLLLGCAKKGKDEQSYGLELTATLYTSNNQGVIRQLDNPDNVLIPYIAERFGLKIKEFLEIPPDLQTKPAQAALLWASSKMLPDIMASGAEEFGSLMDTGLFRPLDDYLTKMPNYQQKIPKRYWPREANPVDGKTYAFYGQSASWPPEQSPDRNDITTLSRVGRAMWVREDVLRAIGYSFTPVMELKKQTVDQGIRPTAEQLRLDPPIDSPAAFLELLRKIKAADLKSVDENDVIPFSMVNWETWHLGVMFDWGYWRINRDGEVDGYLGLPGAHDYLKWLWTAYSEGLMDPDYLVHKTVQLQEKIAAGRVATGEYVANAKNIFAQLEQNLPEAIRHPIPFPKGSPEQGFFDTSSPFSYARVLISNNVPDSVVDKMAALVDWLATDEGQEIISWGPEEAELSHIVSGKRRFVSPELEAGMLNGEQEGIGPYQYGLLDPVMQFPTTPIIAALQPQNRSKNLVMHEYNYVGDYLSLIKSIVGSQPQFSGMPSYLEVANSDQSDVVQKVADWYWSIFPRTYLPQLLTAADEAEFEIRYQELIDAFMRETEYPKAKERMVAYFQRFPPIW